MTAGLVSLALIVLGMMSVAAALMIESWQVTAVLGITGALLLSIGFILAVIVLVSAQT